MPSMGWHRLRPCDRDLSSIVRLLVSGVSLLFLVAGVWSLVNFFRLKSARTALAFAFDVYVIILGTILAFAEIARPAHLFECFGFLSTSSGRAWFLCFLSPLALAAGFSSNRGNVSNVLLIVAGFLGLALTPFALCYGDDHRLHTSSHTQRTGDAHATSPVSSEHTGGGGRTGMFGHKKGGLPARPQGPDSEI
jgi:COPI associated protein